MSCIHRIQGQGGVCEECSNAAVAEAERAKGEGKTVGTHWFDFFREHGTATIQLNPSTVITIDELYRLFMERHKWEEN